MNALKSARLQLNFAWHSLKRRPLEQGHGDSTPRPTDAPSGALASMLLSMSSSPASTPVTLPCPKAGASPSFSLPPTSSSISSPSSSTSSWYIDRFASILRPTVAECCGGGGEEQEESLLEGGYSSSSESRACVIRSRTRLRAPGGESVSPAVHSTKRRSSSLSSGVDARSHPSCIRSMLRDIPASNCWRN